MCIRDRVTSSLLWIESHHLIHQVNRTLTCIRYQLAERCWHKLREGEADLGSELIAFGPLGLGGAAEHGARLVDLVGFIVAWEKWSHQVQLGHDCTEGEDVDRTVIVGTA